ncbi:MAG: organic solvent tolerance protein OstA [Bacteroidetes bacterium]|nr:organic solvent tolerance protein OstA [Bacteroidota bacterium]
MKIFAVINIINNAIAKPISFFCKSVFIPQAFKICIIILFSFLSFSSLAQQRKQIELIQAESMKFDRALGDNVRRLLNNVIFRHEETKMFCDSAYLFPNENRLHAFSKIRIIVNDSVNIYGDKLFYNGNTRIAELHGNVRMVDNKMTLTTDHLFYNLETDVANYYSGGKIVDSDNTLTSVFGYYYSDSKDSFFKKNVVLVNIEYTMYSDTLKYNTNTEIAYFFGPTRIVSDENLIFCKDGWYDTKNDLSRFSKDAYLTNGEQYMSGDSLYYDRKKGYGKAVRNVFLMDSVQNVIVTGEFAEHFEKEGVSEVTINPLMIVIDKTDSLFLHADTLKYVVVENENKEKVKTMFAYHKSKFYRPDLQGLSDSIVYSFSDSIIYMYHDPILWSDKHQLTAKHIQIKTTNNSVKSLHLFDAAFIVTEDDLAKKFFNQVKGRKIDGYVRNNELFKIDVFGNGETIYYVREENGALTGINKTLSNTMTIYIEDKRIVRVTWREKPDSSLFPESKIKEDEMFLQNFKLHSDRRPESKEDIFIWK